MRRNKIFVNASWIIGCKIMQSGLALLINALTARYFGPSNFGLINYAASLVAFVTPLMTLGTSNILVNEIIRHPEEEGTVLGTAVVMTFCSSILCIAGLGTLVWAIDPEDTTTVLVVLLYSLLLMAQSVEQIQYWFHAQYLSKIVSLASFFAYVAIAIYKIVLLIHGKSIYWFAVSNSMDHLLIAVILFAVYQYRDGKPLKFSIQTAKELWDTGKHYIIPGLMGLVLAQSDRVMIRFLCGDTETGFYSAALSVAGLSGFVFSAIITSFTPSILESRQRSAVQFESNMVKLYGLITYLALIQGLVLTVSAKFIIRILYGQEYLPAAPILQAVIWYTIFSYIGGVRSVWILAENKQNYLWIISFCGMLLNIVLNFVWIPVFQGVGAAVATTITQVFTNVILVFFVKPLRVNIHYLVRGLNIRNLIGQKK